MALLSVVDTQIGEITESAPTFDDFWTLYPRHVAKLAARKAWARIDPVLHVEILTAVAAWRRVWSKKEPEYIPHPATWLNGERWEDELPIMPVMSAAAHAPAQLPARGERTEMPEHVRSLIARLRRA